ncbi:MAG TPA: ABC transporter permease [Actinomycetes bacterium]
MSELPAAGAIYDRGYRHYDGPREGRSRRIKAIVVAGVRRVLGLKRNWKTKVVPFALIVAAFGPVLAFIGIRLLVGEAAGQFLGYPDYFGLVAVVLLLFAATAAPELLCPDRRQHVLALVFTRPVTRVDYLAAKLAALLLVIGLVALLPLVILYAGNALTAPSAATYLRHHLGDLGRILFAGGVLTVFYAVVSLAVASLAERRSLATAGLLGTFLASSALANAMFFSSPPTTPGRRWLTFVSLGGLPTRFVDWVFGEPFPAGSLAGQAGFTGPAYLIALAVLTLLAGALLAWRIARLQP